MDRDEVKVHKRAKNERGQYLVILAEQVWSIRDLSYEKRGLVSRGALRAVSSSQGSAIVSSHRASHVEKKAFLKLKIRLQTLAIVRLIVYIAKLGLIYESPFWQEKMRSLGFGY